MDFRLQECLDALGPEVIIIDDKNKKSVIVQSLIDSFPPTSWGRIDWNKIPKKYQLGSENEIIDVLHKFRKTNFDGIYIVWHNGSLPVVKSSLRKIIDALYDVLTVSCDTWLYCPTEGWVIEFHHDGEITLGIA